MKISGRKAKRIMLGLMLCGSFASTAHAGLTYTTYEVTEETKTVTYTDASGVEHTYSYTTKVATAKEAEVTGLTYESPTGGTDEIYYAWTEDGFVQVEDASLADVTAKHDVNTETEGFYNDGTTEYDKQDITGDFVNDRHGYSGGDSAYGGAIEQRAHSENATATLGDITGNFIGNNEDGVSNEYGGAIYSQAASAGSTVIVGDVTGNFIGNYLHAEDLSSGGYQAGGAILNYAYGENSKAYMGNVTGDFIGNYAKAEKSEGSNCGGGAIMNRTCEAGGYVQMGVITGNFIGNYAESHSGNGADGGAIAQFAQGDGSTAVILGINGNFIGNYAYESDSTASGGAIHNITTDEESTAEIKYITGDFYGNYAISNEYNAYGGAICNEDYSGTGTACIGDITGDFYGNYAISNKSIAYGGAIYNENASGTGTAHIGDITGNFYGNWVSAAGDEGDAFGGAVNNTTMGAGTAEIGNITGDFIGNYVKSGDRGRGGAIYNHANATGGKNIIGDITGNFYGNYVEASGSQAWGGAIYNRAYGEESTVQIGTITGDFIGNYAKGTGNAYASGGAIFNQIYGDGDIAQIGKITGSFIGNYAESEGSYATGGAIHNEANGESTAQINGIEGDFTGNYAASESSYAQGGAIYNTGTIGDIKGNFIANYAQGEEEALGGAIYNDEGTIGDITAEDAGFAGNYAKGEEESYGGAIYSIDGTIGSIAANFTGNYAGGYDESGEMASGSAAGGAIYLEYTEVKSITGDFTGNCASGTGSALGGAIFTSDGGKIEKITGSFKDNYAESGLLAEGGALYLTEETLALEITGDFENNRAVSGYTALGGAITGYVSLTVNGNLKNNYAQAGSGDARGGAAYIMMGNFTVTGDITGNYAVSEEGNAYGGALALGADTESTDDITGKIAGNYAEAENGNALGGALYTSHTTSIKGDIENNHVTGGDLAMGGAIYSKGFLTAEGNFTGNYAEASGNAYGGAVAAISGELGDMEITLTGDFTNNHVQSSSGNAYGGAVLNYYDAKELGYMYMDVTGNFTGNYAEAEEGAAQGGAVWNSGTSRITGDYLSYNSATGLSAKGGAVYNGLPESSSEWGADFSETFLEVAALRGNSAVGKEEAYGGAIYNESYLYVLEGLELTGNYAESETGGAFGGAIYNTGSMGTYTEDGEFKEDTLSLGGVTGNHAESSGGDAAGGAVYFAEGGTVNVAGNVTGNYVKAAGEAKGGAIYAGEGTVVTLSGNITGNSATGGTALGGAIYNAGTVNINIENQNAVISGNKTVSGGTEEANVLYGTAGSVTNFDLTDATLRLDDSLKGETGYEVNISGNGTDSATFYMFNDILDSNLSFDSTTINTINNEVKAYSVNKLSINGDVNFAADVDLSGETMDRFTASEYGEHAGNLNVSALNGISDTDKDRVGIYFAEPGLKENVTASVTGVTSPIYTYDVAYDKNYDGSWGDDGGYFVFEKTGENPAVMTPSVAQAGLFSAASMMYNYVFEHSEYYMNQPYHVRFEEKEAENEEEGSCHVRRESSLTERGVWVRPFASFETVPFKGKFTVRDKYYGALIGIDGDMKDVGNGWSSVFTGYAGYQGIHQGYTGGTIRQDGGVVGVTENLYRKNFFTAVTAAGTMETADGRTAYGREKAHLYTYGLAAKAGWNLSFREGKYSFLPSFMASYTNVGMEKYKNAAGVKIDPEDMRGLQLNPNFKLIRNLKDCMPYITAGEVWTVAQKSGFKADSFDIDGYHIRPYTEFGIGVQKKWNGTGDGYLQVLGHAGGRRGMLFNLGLRWNF